MRRLLWCCLFLLPLSAAYAEALWPQFRGVDGQGHADVTGVPLRWSEAENVTWKTPIPGLGWSSPVVAEGKVWLTTAIVQQASEEERLAKVAGSMIADVMEVAKSITLWVVEIDLHSGSVLQTIKLFDVDSPQPIHSLNSYASPTPVYEAGRLYCHFGAHGTVCLETPTGNILWQNHLELDHRVGAGSSPVLYEDLLILTCDGADLQYIAALDKQTGNEVWRTGRPPIRSEEPEFRKAFSTPLLIHTAGEDQLVIPGAQWFAAYQPQTGEEIWRIDHGSGFSNVPRPVFDGQFVFLCTGFTAGQLWAVRPDGRGDVTDTQHVAWRQKKQIPHMASPLVVGTRIYTISDGGIAKCFDTATGELLWRKRVPGKYSSSPLYADGRIYFCSHEGRTTVIAPGDEYQELAQNDLDGQILASPVVAEGDLLLRTDTHLYRVGD
ncbi:MAG: PQQ-binding-like beta-propeller repeat protein [Pirellulales bacterium]|nr:PQQ-binding-like beta-propeller repeat protein [Pirellulales bacterium]